MKTITVTIEVYDNSSVEDVERAVSAGLDSNGIDCTYDADVSEPEKSQEDVKSVDKKRNEVADMPVKQSNLGNAISGGKLSDRPAERTSLQEKLAAMKARVSGTPAGRDAVDKIKEMQ